MESEQNYEDDIIDDQPIILNVPFKEEPFRQKTQRKAAKKNERKQLTLSSLDREKVQELSTEEQFLLQAVEDDNEKKVERILRQINDINVNCADLLGRTPLRIAVENDHLEIVQLLLDRCDPKSVYEAVLVSIKADHSDITRVIVNHGSYERAVTYMENQDILQFQKSNAGSEEDDSLFQGDITPLILASQQNQYDIISLLISKGEQIKKPHGSGCSCTECKSQVKKDEMRFAKSRLETYKGLTSEAYIALKSSDPVITAFELGREMGKRAAQEKHFKDDYVKLKENLNNFTVKLLDQIHGNEELGALLNYCPKNHPELEGKLSLLKLALQYEEKEFVAHPMCQKMLHSIWVGNCDLMEGHSSLVSFLQCCLLMMTYPFMAVAFLFLPNSKIGRLLQTPFVKFLAHTSAFCWFLVQIVVYSATDEAGSSAGYLDPSLAFLWEKYSHKFGINDTDIDKKYFRKNFPGGITLSINLWLIGLLWLECKQVYAAGFWQYISSLFNIIDMTSLSLYVTSYTLRYVTYVKTYISIEYFQHDSSWKAYFAGDEEANQRMYWLIADRYYWDEFDPYKLNEGLFAIANVLSFSRLFAYIALNDELGPLQVSLRCMARDIVIFFVMFAIVFLAFLVGLNNLYWYYLPGVREEVELPLHPPLETAAENAFGSFELTFTTVYWSLMGFGDYNVVEIAPDYGSAFTQRIGYIVFGAYCFSATIVLLNVCIAMMARSFETIQVCANVEWKFARSLLYMEFIEDGCTLPPPFNIIPNPVSIFMAFRKFCCMTSVYTPENSSNSYTFNSSEFEDENSNRKETKTTPARKPLQYHAVVKKLATRFIFHAQDADDTEDDSIDDLKQDISMLRCEMMNQSRSLQNSINYICAKLDTPGERRSSFKRYDGDNSSHLGSPRGPSPILRRRDFSSSFKGPGKSAQGFDSTKKLSSSFRANGKLSPTPNRLSPNFQSTANSTNSEKTSKPETLLLGDLDVEVPKTFEGSFKRTKNVSDSETNFSNTHSTQHGLDTENKGQAPKTRLKEFAHNTIPKIDFIINQKETQDGSDPYIGTRL